MKPSESIEKAVTESYLADILKTETWDLHKTAETTGAIDRIIRKSVTLDEYAVFIKNLLPIYEALERSHLWLRNFDGLADFINPVIYRSDALRNDLKALETKMSLKPLLPILKSTQSYSKNIQKASVNSSAAMLGHVYVRYLGDLNGGRVLQSLLSKTLNLDGSCLKFYAFPEVEDIVSFREGLRKALNDLALSQTEKEEAIMSAKTAFHFNISLSEAVSHYNDC